jgi:hypothetical protein
MWRTSHGPTTSDPPSEYCSSPEHKPQLYTKPKRRQLQNHDSSHVNSTAVRLRTAGSESRDQSSLLSSNHSAYPNPSTYPHLQKASYSIIDSCRVISLSLWRGFGDTFCLVSYFSQSSLPGARTLASNLILWYQRWYGCTFVSICFRLRRCSFRRKEGMGVPLQGSRGKVKS